MTGDVLVVAQQLLPQPLGVCVDDAEADVVDDRADVGDVVVQPLELEQHCATGAFLVRHLHPEGLFHGHRVGQGVADGGVAADAFG